MKSIRIITPAFLLALLLIFSGSPVYAASYTITLTNNGVAKNTDVIFSHNSADEGDELSHKIMVANQDSNAYVIRLKSVTVIQDDRLVDKLTFGFSGLTGENKITFTQENFEQLGQPELYVAAKQSLDYFTLHTAIGKLTNEAQGAQTTLRYTFEITRLYDSDSDISGDTTPPVTGDDAAEKILLLGGLLLCSATLLLFLVIWKRRQKNDENKEELVP